MNALIISEKWGRNFTSENQINVCCEKTAADTKNNNNNNN